jgi:hypothetical protein
MRLRLLDSFQLFFEQVYWLHYTLNKVALSACVLRRSPKNEKLTPKRLIFTHFALARPVTEKWRAICDLILINAQARL